MKGNAPDGRAFQKGRRQMEDRDFFGLIGEKLGHSWSPPIHEALGDYAYRLIELQPEEVGPFLRKKAFQGINVTIPYKQTVIPYLDDLSARAKAIGSVNTIVRRKDGSLAGYNTDFGGFEAMLRQAHLDPAGKKCLVLGSGGASKTVVACLRAGGASEIRVISRSGEDNYDNLSRHRDARLLINATPVGMYPKTDASPVNLSLFPELEGVADLIYNPEKTQLLRQAEILGLRAVNGLYMLVEQARLASELFTGRQIAAEKTEEVMHLIQNRIKSETGEL